MNDERQLIIAGDNNQAATIARLRGLKVNQYVSVRDPSQLMCERRREGRTVWLYGTYYRRPSWQDLKVTVLACGYELVEVEGNVLCEYFRVPLPMSDEDIELTCRALRACGYRVHIKERAGTRWVTAVRGLEVQYKHWHPLTNINQALQLLIDADGLLSIHRNGVRVYVDKCFDTPLIGLSRITAAELINAQCRAIVTACASMEVVR